MEDANTQETGVVHDRQISRRHFLKATLGLVAGALSGTAGLGGDNKKSKQTSELKMAEKVEEIDELASTILETTNDNNTFENRRRLTAILGSTERIIRLIKQDALIDFGVGSQGSVQPSDILRIISAERYQQENNVGEAVTRQVSHGEWSDSEYYVEVGKDTPQFWYMGLDERAEFNEKTGVYKIKAKELVDIINKIPAQQGVAVLGVSFDRDSTFSMESNINTEVRWVYGYENLKKYLADKYFRAVEFPYEQEDRQGEIKYSLADYAPFKTMDSYQYVNLHPEGISNILVVTFLVPTLPEDTFSLIVNDASLFADISGVVQLDDLTPNHLQRGVEKPYSELAFSTAVVGLSAINPDIYRPTRRV